MAKVKLNVANIYYGVRACDVLENLVAAIGTDEAVIDPSNESIIKRIGDKLAARMSVLCGGHTLRCDKAQVCISRSGGVRFYWAGNGWAVRAENKEATMRTKKIKSISDLEQATREEDVVDVK